MNQNDDFESDFESESESEKPKSITRFLDIPELLHSVEKDAPFANCLKCGASLLTTNRRYIIKKVFRSNEVIIEMAICLQCGEGEASDGMSENSARSLKQFIEHRIDFQRRIELMSHVNETESLKPWFERCLFSDKPSGMFTEFEIVALCRGPRVQRDFYPALISAEATEELSAVLSPETRDWMDDFVGDNFGMPSEFCDSPTFSPVIM